MGRAGENSSKTGRKCFQGVRVRVTVPNVYPYAFPSLPIFLPPFIDFLTRLLSKFILGRGGPSVFYFVFLFVDYSSIPHLPAVVFPFYIFFGLLCLFWLWYRDSPTTSLLLLYIYILSFTARQRRRVAVALSSGISLFLVILYT